MVQKTDWMHTVKREHSKAANSMCSVAKLVQKSTGWELSLHSMSFGQMRFAKWPTLLIMKQTKLPSIWCFQNEMLCKALCLKFPFATSSHINFSFPTWQFLHGICFEVTDHHLPWSHCFWKWHILHWSFILWQFLLCIHAPACDQQWFAWASGLAFLIQNFPILFAKTAFHDWQLFGLLFIEVNVLKLKALMSGMGLFGTSPKFDIVQLPLGINWWLAWLWWMVLSPLVLL